VILSTIFWPYPNLALINPDLSISPPASNAAARSRTKGLSLLEWDRKTPTMILPL
jgi:hypothetical protein